MEPLIQSREADKDSGEYIVYGMKHPLHTSV